MDISLLPKFRQMFSGRIFFVFSRYFLHNLFLPAVICDALKVSNISNCIQPFAFLCHLNSSWSFSFLEYFLLWSFVMIIIACLVSSQTDWLCMLLKYMWLFYDFLPQGLMLKPFALCTMRNLRHCCHPSVFAKHWTSNQTFNLQINVTNFRKLTSYLKAAHNPVITSSIHTVSHNMTPKLTGR